MKTIQNLFLISSLIVLSFAVIVKIINLMFGVVLIQNVGLLFPTALMIFVAWVAIKDFKSV